jgi:hypothetical protein
VQADKLLRAIRSKYLSGNLVDKVVSYVVGLGEENQLTRFAAFSSQFVKGLDLRHNIAHVVILLLSTL